MFVIDPLAMDMLQVNNNDVQPISVDYSKLTFSATERLMLTCWDNLIGLKPPPRARVHVCVCVRFPSVIIPLYKGRMRTVSSECKTYQVNFTNWISFLPCNLMVGSPKTKVFSSMETLTNNLGTNTSIQSITYYTLYWYNYIGYKYTYILVNLVLGTVLYILYLVTKSFITIHQRLTFNRPLLVVNS